MTRPALRHGARLILTVAAIIYLLVDALFLAAVRPLSRWLSRWALLTRLQTWVTAQNRYVALALVLVPLILLEPLKPLSFYLAAKEHFVVGAVLLGAGEVIKITMVERLFQMTKPKLLTFMWFARSYAALQGWIGYLTSLPVSQVILRRYRMIRARLVSWTRAVTQGIAPE